MQKVKHYYITLSLFFMKRDYLLTFTDGNLKRINRPNASLNHLLTLTKFVSDVRCDPQIFGLNLGLQMSHNHTRIDYGKGIYYC